MLKQILKRLPITININVNIAIPAAAPARSAIPKIKAEIRCGRTGMIWLRPAERMRYLDPGVYVVELV